MKFFSLSDRMTLRRKYLFVLAITLVLAAYAGGSFMNAHTGNFQPDIASVLQAAAQGANGNGSKDLEMFLKFDTAGIPGDAMDEKHKSELVIDSFSWGQLRNVKDKAPGMEDFVFTMPVSKASPKLFLYGAGGSLITKATFSVRKKGMNQDFLKWTFTNVLITSYKTVGNTHGDGVVDQVSFAFDRLQMDFRPVLPDGTLGESVSAGFDRRNNAPTGK